MGKGTILHFHIGRGGEFYNPGHWTFEGIEDNSVIIHRLNYPLDEDENEILEGSLSMLDDVGSKVGATIDEYNEGIGVYDFDGTYDTDIFLYPEDLDDNEIEMILSKHKVEDFKYYYPDLYDVLIEYLDQV